MPVMKCVCGVRLDPAAGTVHPACEDTDSARFIRAKHLSAKLRNPPAKRPRLPRLAAINPDLDR